MLIDGFDARLFVAMCMCAAVDLVGGVLFRCRRGNGH